MFWDSFNNTWRSHISATLRAKHRITVSCAPLQN